MVKKCNHHVSQVMLHRLSPVLPLKRLLPLSVVSESINSQRLQPLSFVASVAFEAIATAIVCRQCCL